MGRDDAARTEPADRLAERPFDQILVVLALRVERRLDPTFELNEHGFTSFPGMLKALPDLVEIRKGEHDQQVRLKQGNNPCSTKSD